MNSTRNPSPSGRGFAIEKVFRCFARFRADRYRFNLFPCQSTGHQAMDVVAVADAKLHALQPIQGSLQSMQNT